MISSLFITFGILAWYIKSLPMYYVHILFALLYGVAMFVPTYVARPNVDKDKLIIGISEKWKQPNDLANHIIKYWVGFNFYFSAPGRRKNCLVISVMSVLWGVKFLLSYDPFYTEQPIYFSITYFLSSIILFLTAMKVNVPLIDIQNALGGVRTKDIEKSVISWIALSDLMGGSRTTLAEQLREDNNMQDILSRYAKE